MDKKKLCRGLVGLVTALVGVVMLSNPASATTWSNTGYTGSGSSILIGNTSGTVTDTIAIGGTGGSGGAGCANSLSTVSDDVAATVDITALSSVTRFQLSGSGTYYVLEMSRVSSTPGALSSVTTTSATASNAGVVVRADIYTATDQTPSSTSCVHGTTRACRFNNVSVSLSGTFAGNVYAPWLFPNVWIWSSPVAPPLVIVTPCIPPFTTYTSGVWSFPTWNWVF